jgi:acetylornithine/N-succinyldiaminopimelate aminotransferase
MTFLNTYARFPLELVRGEGLRVQDSDGRWYLDALGGIAVLALGHGHPRVLAAVHAQVDRLMHTSNLFSVGTQRALADRLTEMYSGGSVFLSNSGVEANEGAVKLCRKWHFRQGGPRSEIITLEGAFHGRTLLGLAMTPKPAYREGMGPFPADVRNVAVEEAAAAISNRTAALFIEPIQGESGCRSLLSFLPALRAACDAHGALLVYDEVQCGLGRSGEIEHSPAPDVRTLAKALGGGLPLGAIVASPKVADGFQPGDHGSTFGGNPVACAAGLATLDTILEQGLAQRCQVMGERLQAGLEAAGARVTGEGLIRAAWTDVPAGDIVAGMRERGVLVCTAGDKAVRFLPPFLFGEAEVDEAVAAFAAAYEAVRGAA